MAPSLSPDAARLVVSTPCSCTSGNPRHSVRRSHRLALSHVFLAFHGSQKRQITDFELDWPPRLGTRPPEPSVPRVLSDDPVRSVTLQTCLHRGLHAPGEPLDCSRRSLWHPHSWPSCCAAGRLCGGDRLLVWPSAARRPGALTDAPCWQRAPLRQFRLLPSGPAAYATQDHGAGTPA